MGSRRKKIRKFMLQEQEEDDEIFLNTKDPVLRIFWLKEEIASTERT